MTLLVKDEIDIIEHTIQHHLNVGVDYIIATDNLSTDGTLEVLEKYERQGVLHLIREPEQTHSQSKWVNRMGIYAKINHNPDFIIHADADEFWCTSSGNLKFELAKFPLIDVLRVPIKNVLLQFDRFNEHFPKDSKYVVDQPLVSKNLESDFKTTPLFFFKYPSKVMYKVSQEYIDVKAGNHAVKNSKAYVTCDSSDICVYHFPVRSKKQFFNKVVQGGKALERNTELHKTVGWHWRYWYELYKNDQLEKEYLKFVLTSEVFESWKNKGVIVKMGSISSRPELPNFLKGLHL